MRDGEPRHNGDSRGFGPYSTSIKKAEKEKEIKEMAKKFNDLCELGLSDISRKLNLKRLFAPSTNGAVKRRYFVDELPATSPWATPVKRWSRSGENLSDEDRLYNSTSDNVFVNVVASIHYRAQSEKANDAFYRLTNTRSQIQAYISDDTQSTMLYSFVILPSLL
ncbi:hypothetical protein OROGR_013022 [Orobanche gracilis]